MLNIKNINHIGIRVSNKNQSVNFYQLLGFELIKDAGFAQGHPIIMTHPSGVTLNLLGPSTPNKTNNILMDIEHKHTGVTNFALTVTSLEQAKVFVQANDITITGSFSFSGMSAIFIRDPDRNVIELDAYDRDVQTDSEDLRGYTNHP